MNTLRRPPVVQVHALEPRCLLAVSAFDDRPATLADSDGSQITISIDGPGSAKADVVNNRLRLRLREGSPDTILTISVSGGDGRAVAGELRIGGAVGGIRAPNVQLSGLLRGKSVGPVELHSVNNAEVRVGRLEALTTRRIQNCLISADRIGKISVSGDVTGSRIYVCPANDKPVALDYLSVRGTLQSSTVFVLGDIGAVAAAAMLDSNVTAGVRLLATSTADRLVQPLPDKGSNDELYDFLGTYRIDLVAVTGKTTRDIAFSNTIVAAHEIGQAWLNKVDGNRHHHSKFGVAAYKIGRVDGFFSQRNIAKNVKGEPRTDFKVRQIAADGVQINYTTFADTNLDGHVDITGLSALLMRWDPSGAARINGDPAYSGFVDITDLGPLLTNWLGSAGNVSILLNHLSNKNSQCTDLVSPGGEKIGTVSNHSATKVYLTHSGRYELRNDARAVILSAATLGGLVAELFRDAGTSVKIENVGQTVNLRTTSVGPVMSLESSQLGRGKLAGIDRLGQPIYGYIYNDKVYSPMASYSLSDTTIRKRVVPTFAMLQEQLDAAGIATRVFDQSLLLMTNQSLPLGRVIGVTEQHEINLSRSLRFASADQSLTDLGNLVARLSAGHVGSRRLPARIVVDGDRMTIFGLPDGSTAVVEKLGRSALNAKGDVRTVPNATQLRASLINAGLKLVD